MDATLSDDEVKALLRRAVVAGLIWGWYRHMPFNGVEWVVNPMQGRCSSYGAEDIRVYCAMLAEVVSA